MNEVFPLGGTLVCDCWSMAHPHFLGKSILLKHMFIYVLQVIVSLSAFKSKSAKICCQLLGAH